MNLMEEEKKSMNEAPDSVNLAELSQEIGEMTKYRTVRKEEQLKTYWERKIADQLATLDANVEKFGKITRQSIDKAEEINAATLLKKGQICP